jgi:hypothetical protein
MVKKLLLSAVLLAMINIMPTLSLAQETDTTGFKNPDTRAQFETQYMKRALNLDSAVADSVYNINLKYAKANQELITSEKKKAHKYRELMKSSEAKDKELQKVLTEEQYKKYTETKNEMLSAIKEKMKEKK